MRKLIFFLVVIFTMFISTFCAFASNETIDELIAQLGIKSPEAAAPERKNNQTFGEAWKEIESVKKRLRFKTDKIENITIVSTRLNYDIPFFDIYCAEKGGKIWLRLVMKAGLTSEPMATGKVIINVDGIVHSFSVPSYSRETTSQVSSYRSARTVYTQRDYNEKVDMVVDEDAEKILRLATDGKVTMIRMRGRYYVDFKMSKAAHTSFDAMLRYYKARQILLYGYIVEAQN